MVRRLPSILVCLLVVAGAFWFITKDTVATDPTGPADTCGGVPEFVHRYKFTRATFDTSRRDQPGLVLADGADTNKTPVQEDSWKQFGNLGPIARGKDGAVYTVAVPFINTHSVVSEAHLAILRVDPKNGTLEKWVEIQGPKPSPDNYYGLTALTYDCANNLLYVAGIAGSSKNKESGFIAVIDPASRKERFRYGGTDALGLGIFGSGRGRHLYVGLARTSEVVRIKLSDAGKPFGEPEAVVHFDDFNQTRANKIGFTWEKLHIQTTEFYYNLIASTEFNHQTFSYTYDPDTGTFKAD